MGSTNSGSNNGESASSSVNPDKAIARLLYAMLKQKSLKDIDWPQVASDPALLETISNGHAARMRYARFRASVDNQVQKKQAAAAASAKDEDHKDEEDDKTAVQQTLSRTASKSKKEKTRKASTKRSRDLDGETTDVKSILVKTKDSDFDEKESKEETNVDFLYPGLFADNSLTDIKDQENKLKQDSGSLESKTFEKATEELLSQTSFTSSLPSPPTESVPSMESLAHQERKAKMRKMYAFSPTMKAGTLHQIPLPRGAAMASSSRIHSLPTLPTATASPSSANTPVNLSGALMMRHHSAGSMNDIGPQLQQQQQQMLRQTRLMTPSSDSDLLNNPLQGNHQQYFAHHTQIPLMTDPAVVGGLDPTFDFGSLSTSHGAGANAGGSSTTGHPSPWMATPFSSPPMPTFDMSPYATTLDFVGGGTNADGSPAGETQSMPSLFQTQFDSQHQQQQEALQTSIMAQAFTKNSGWNVMLGQASSSNQNHNI